VRGRDSRFVANWLCTVEIRHVSGEVSAIDAFEDGFNSGGFDDAFVFEAVDEFGLFGVDVGGGGGVHLEEGQEKGIGK